MEKQRHYLPTKVHIIKAMVFPVVMYECESWTIKKAECQIIYAFVLWCWGPLECKEMLLVHPRRNQSWIFIGRTDVESKLQSFGHLMQRADSFEKTLMLAKIEGRRRKGRQRMRWLDSITDSMNMNLSKLGDSEGQRSLVLWDWSQPWDWKESDMT